MSGFVSQSQPFQSNVQSHVLTPQTPFVTTKPPTFQNSNINNASSSNIPAGSTDSNLRVDPEHKKVHKQESSDLECEPSEFGDELSFLVGQVQFQERKESFMPYIY
eukprot:TRINITY_DN7562_c0_g1_i1.p1 TRINITY_DN7562_c0_g1~~TRINITY_DN7562_c0_g1_i1.p1  ORF type:complete len:106 (+),score=6.87 TRINITY_DN7562_c0_g1_i1:174-491(+)